MATPPNVYFERDVPRQYAAALVGAPERVLDQPELTVTYTIDGAEGGSFGLRTQGRTLAYVPGGIEGSDLLVRQSYEHWLRGVESGAAELVVDYVLRCKVGVAKGIKGAVTLELTHADGSLHETTVVFGGQTEPAVTLRMTTEDYRAMMSGELNGTMAFMLGKLRFEGSLPLLMQIGALSG
ncbi:MAG TPA: SCP2 sterol-binding domain-containing protein [Roseiflexaceae bacterium]|nr:SCP2 sterol-binding domain-containing protein [Roseiflexaceae bacterium]